jgi:hypothetical protein
LVIDDGSARLEAELRRGTLVLAVLAALRERQYGYSLRQALSAAGLPVEEGTLYPLLRRASTPSCCRSPARCPRSCCWPGRNCCAAPSS